MKANMQVAYFEGVNMFELKMCFFHLDVRPRVCCVSMSSGSCIPGWFSIYNLFKTIAMIYTSLMSSMSWKQEIAKEKVLNNT